MIKRKIYYYSFTILFLSTLMGCIKSNSREMLFELDGKSKLRITNMANDTINIFVDQWLNIIPIEEKIDTVIAPNGSLELSISTESKDYYFVTINKKKYRLFTAPNELNEMHILDTSGAVKYSGTYANINNYLKTFFVYSDFNVWNEGLHSNVPFSQVKKSNDSVLKAQLSRLNKYVGLPEWYVEFENQRIQFIHAEANLSAMNYRKKMMSSTEKVPDDFLDQMTSGLTIENESYLGIPAYMSLLSKFIQFKLDPNQENNPPISDKAYWVNYVEKTIAEAEKNFKNPMIKDVFLSNFFLTIYAIFDYVWQNDWLNHINDKEIRNYVKRQIKAAPVLANGASLPNFELENSANKLIKPEAFQGKILLINFWATWCAPCVQEFEHENVLVDQFKNKKVAIVNICIDSDKELWLKYIDKYRLQTINLFADTDQTNRLELDFGINGLPHSILVDETGKVIKNKCKRASAGVDKMILEALDKRNLENNALNLN